MIDWFYVNVKNIIMTLIGQMLSKSHILGFLPRFCPRSCALAYLKPENTGGSQFGQVPMPSFMASCTVSARRLLWVPQTSREW